MAVHTILDSYPTENIAIISPLAEGADRLVAFRVLVDSEASLVVPLPLDVDEYMKDFDSMVSKAEFVNLLEQAKQVFVLPEEETRQASYLAAGLYVLDHSDVLIALWDGAPAQGTGGTADIVAEARKRGMPLAWVQVKRESQSKQSKRGKNFVDVHYERFPDQLENEAGKS